ncbi:hypothetical protein [Sphingobacterium sp. NPDC055431]
MRKIVAICLLLIYSVCSTGATIHMHHCGKSTMFSVLEESKVSHDSCPMCSNLHQDHDHADDLETNSQCEDDHTCQDSKVNLELTTESDQLRSKMLFGSTFDFSPAIVLIPWIINHWVQIIEDKPEEPNPFKPSLFAESHSVYLLNCTFII